MGSRGRRGQRQKHCREAGSTGLRGVGRTSRTASARKRDKGRPEELVSGGAGIPEKFTWTVWFGHGGVAMMYASGYPPSYSLPGCGPQDCPLPFSGCAEVLLSTAAPSHGLGADAATIGLLSPGDQGSSDSDSASNPSDLANSPQTPEWPEVCARPPPSSALGFRLEGRRGKGCSYGIQVFCQEGQVVPVVSIDDYPIGQQELASQSGYLSGES